MPIPFDWFLRYAPPRQGGGRSSQPKLSEQTVRRFLYCLALSAALVSTPACAGEAGSPAAPAPAMWRLKDANSEIVLFGTFHILPPATNWKTAAFSEAMARTETTITEADVSSPEAQAALTRLVQQYGVNPPGVTLSSLLGAERAARFAMAAGEYGLPMAALETYRPWLAMLTLSVTAMQKSGFDPNSGVEKSVLAIAAEEKDRLQYLEDPEDQIIALTKLDGPEMQKGVDDTLDQLADFEAYMNGVLEAWRTGDLDAIDKEMLQAMRAESPKAFDALFVERNSVWTNRIDELMKGEGDYFIAVGAGHLVGADSVIDLLARKGYVAERLQ